jgi:two-component system sensor histidine kinase EvgS
VSALVNEIVRGLRYAVGPGVQLTQVVAAPAAIVLDTGKYRQILNNLLANVIKFTPAGQISVGVRWQDGWLYTAVRDTGIGMTSKQVDVMFQAYAPRGTSAAPGLRGTGLELAICKGLVDLMGGRLDVTTQPGQGTAFTFNLPAAQAVGTALVAPAKDMAQMPPVALRCSVLAVDDNPVNLLVLRSQFQALNWPLVTCSSGQDALVLWQTTQFTLLLLDCHMPNPDGYEVARHIRAAEQAQGGASRSTLVAVSAHADPVHAALCRASGMDDVLVKPLRLADLQQVLLRFAVARVDTIDSVDDAAMNDIRAMMRQTKAEDGVSLRQALDRRDAPALARLAHRVHGAALVVGADKLAQAVLDLEMLARTQPLAWPRLAAAVGAVLTAMDDYANEFTADTL